MPLTLMYITNNPTTAQIAQEAGVDRVWIDMEYIGKDELQGGMNTVKNHHTIDDVKRLRPVVTSAEQMVRVNPLHAATENYSSSEEEINQTIDAGADVYIDMLPHEVVSIFTKKKLKMRAGETDKAVSFKDEKLFALIERFVKDAGYNGQIDVDIFDVNGEYYISEVNPRFGGGYPHAFESGVDHMKLIVNNLNGKANERFIGKYDDGAYMMKYNELMIRRDN